MSEKLSINKEYASRYNKQKKLEDYQKNEYLLEEDDESSSSEEEDDDGFLVTPKYEESFINVLTAIKSKDKEIYKKDKKFFPSLEETIEEAEKLLEEEDDDDNGKKEGKKFTIQDYYREEILQKMKEEEGGTSSKKEEIKKPSLFEQKRSLKEEFLSAANGEQDEDDDDIFVKRKKTDSEMQEEDLEFEKWREEENKRNKILPNRKATHIEILEKFWQNDDTEDKRELFLRNFIVGEGWIDKGRNKIPTYDEIVGNAKKKEKETAEEEFRDYLQKSKNKQKKSLFDDNDSDEGDDDDKEFKPKYDILKKEDYFKYDEDEADLVQLENQEKFEAEYNFRFEEPEGHVIKTYSREIEDSVRRKSSKRKRKREKRKEKKRLQKIRKEEEIKRLKNIKKQEILSKLKEIEEITGNSNVYNLDLDKEFDPEEYDSQMSDLFNDDYYDKDDDDLKKPVFDDNNADFDDIYEQYMDDEDDNDEEDFYEGSSNNNNEYDEDDDDDEGYGEKKEKQDKKKEIKNKKKEVKDFIDDYYSLNYQDLIGGDTPVRFGYKKVKKNNFGLTPQDLVFADDKELNAYVSLKKLAPYRKQEFRTKKRFRHVTPEDLNFSPKQIKLIENIKPNKKGKKSKKKSLKPKKKRRKLK